TRTPVSGSVTPGVYTGSVPPLPSTKPRLATVPPETVMKLLALSATPLLVAKVVLRPRPPVATLLNKRLEKAATVDCSVPSETSLSLLSSTPGTGMLVFCNPNDSSRVTDQLMVIVVAMTSSSWTSRLRSTHPSIPASAAEAAVLNNQSGGSIVRDGGASIDGEKIFAGKAAVLALEQVVCSCKRIGCEGMMLKKDASVYSPIDSYRWIVIDG